MAFGVGWNEIADATCGIAARLRQIDRKEAWGENFGLPNTIKTVAVRSIILPAESLLVLPAVHRRLILRPSEKQEPFRLPSDSPRPEPATRFIDAGKSADRCRANSIISLPITPLLGFLETRLSGRPVHCGSWSFDSTKKIAFDHHLKSVRTLFLLRGTAHAAVANRLWIPRNLQSALLSLDEAEP